MRSGPRPEASADAGACRQGRGRRPALRNKGCGGAGARAPRRGGGPRAELRNLCRRLDSAF
eukprot:7528037-Pyramimonas_sp.AAC.1